MSTGLLRIARGRLTPTGISVTAAAALNRAPAGKGRAVALVVAIPSSAKSAARALAGEKKNTPERVQVKEEGDDKVALPPLAVEGAHSHKGGVIVVQKAQSESEKDTLKAVAKTRASRTRAASGRK